jgi:hypothetical protein
VRRRNIRAALHSLVLRILCWMTSPLQTGLRYASVPVGPGDTASASSGSSRPSVDSPLDVRCAESSAAPDSETTPAAPSPTTQVSAPPAHPYGTRLRNNIRQPKVSTEDTITYASIKTSAEPTSYTGVGSWMMNFMLFSRIRHDT